MMTVFGIDYLIATGSIPGEYRDLNIGSSNGTLRLDPVRKGDEGNYLCEARNGVGSGLSKVVFLKVNGEEVLIAPSVRELPQSGKLKLIRQFTTKRLEGRDGQVPSA